MGFSSAVPAWRKESISETIKYASLGISLIVLKITSLMMTDILMNVHWATISFNQYVYEVEYNWINLLVQNGMLELMVFPCLWYG